jgi:hypothetical protein
MEGSRLWLGRPATTDSFETPVGKKAPGNERASGGTGARKKLRAARDWKNARTGKSIRKRAPVPLNARKSASYSWSSW